MPEILISQQSTLANIKSFSDDLQANSDIRGKDQKDQSIKVYEKVKDHGHSSQAKIEGKIDKGRVALVDFLKSQLTNPAHQQRVDGLMTSIDHGAEHFQLKGSHLARLLSETFLMKNEEGIDNFKSTGNGFSDLDNTAQFTQNQKQIVDNLTDMLFDSQVDLQEVELSGPQLKSIAQQAVDRVRQNIASSEQNVDKFFGQDGVNNFSSLAGMDQIVQADKLSIAAELKEILASRPDFGSETVTLADIKELATPLLQKQQNLNATKANIETFFANSDEISADSLEHTDAFKPPQDAWLKNIIVSQLMTGESTHSLQDIKSKAQELVNQFNTKIAGGPSLLSAQQMGDVLNSAKFVEQTEASPVETLTKEKMIEAGLEPKFRVTVGDKEISMSEPFLVKDGRIGCMAYIKNDSEEYEVHSFYRSNSRGDWQCASHFANDENPQWLGKGAGGGKSSTVLPIEMQKHMNKMLDAMPERGVEGNSTSVEWGADFDKTTFTFSPGAQIFYGALEFETNTTFAQAIEEQYTGIKLVANNDTIKSSLSEFNPGEISMLKMSQPQSQKLTEFSQLMARITIDEALMPDFEALVDRFPIRMSDEYSNDCEAFVFQGEEASIDDRDVQLKFMFVKDNESGNIFLASVEDIASDINDFATRSRSYDLDLLGMGAVEYPEMLPSAFQEIQRRGAEAGTYVGVTNFHENVGLITSAAEAINAL